MDAWTYMVVILSFMWAFLEPIYLDYQEANQRRQNVISEGVPFYLEPATEPDFVVHDVPPLKVGLDTPNPSNILPVEDNDSWMTTEDKITYDNNLKLELSDVVSIGDVTFSDCLVITQSGEFIFRGDGVDIGKLTIQDGQIIFEGEAGESAQIFIEQIINRYKGE